MDDEAREPATGGIGGEGADGTGGDDDANGPVDSPRSGSVDERLDRLERQLADLAASTGAPTAPRSPAADAAATPRTAGAPSPAGTSPADPADTSSPAAPADPFFLLHALQREVPSPGAVAYVGSVDLAAGHVEYQWGRPTAALLEADWAERAEPLAALGHPLRLAMLRLLVDAERTVAEIVDALELASTGVAYHHLHQLQAGGWVHTPRRGVWAVPVARIIPLLAILTAVDDG